MGTCVLTAQPAPMSSLVEVGKLLRSMPRQVTRVKKMLEIQYALFFERQNFYSVIKICAALHELFFGVQVPFLGCVPLEPQLALAAESGSSFVQKFADSQV